MSLPTSFKLNSGTEIPAVGLGTWKSEPGKVADAVAHAIKSGYRHIDGALCYQNEEEVGEGIRKSGVRREELFITSKLWCTYHDRVEEGVDKTLKSLGTDYLDLYLIHWPVRLVPNGTSELFPVKPDGSRNIDRTWNQADTWRQMEALVKSGKVKAIGVSNFSQLYLERLAKGWTIPPAVNQVELHPCNPQHGLKAWCDKHGIRLEAYSPLGSNDSPLHSDPVIKAIAEKHGVQPATVLISYQVNRGVVVLPKSVTPARIESNKQIIKLDDEDMKQLDGLATAGKQHRFVSPPWGTDLGFDDWFGPGNANAPAGTVFESKGQTFEGQTFV